MFGGGSVGNGGGSGLFSGTGGDGSVTGSSTTGANDKRYVRSDFSLKKKNLYYSRGTVGSVDSIVGAGKVSKKGNVFFLSKKI